MKLPVNSFLQGGKYKIERFINCGGFGCTYEARHVMLQKRIAIKEFFVKDFCNRGEDSVSVYVGTQSKVALVNRLKGKFIEEAVSLSQMSHPNIVKVTDVFEENGTAYYVMDYIDGASLDQIVKSKGRLAEKEALSYIRQVADALDHVHSMNRLHLDIKPGNIMINSGGQAILIDFGVSKQYDSVEGENTSTLLGKTPGYAPIEQMGNSVQQFTPATDIYALGATLYKLLSGITPPEANIIIEDGVPELDRSISERTKETVVKAMEFRRKDRQQSIKEFLSMLPTDGNQKTDNTVQTAIFEETEAEISEETIIGNHPTSAVDLGLSVRWASVNIGAEKPWQIGDLSSWDEAVNSREISSGQWRMPTEREIEELRRNCRFVRDSQEGVEGYSVIGKNGGSIFLPFTGYRHGTVIKKNYEIGNYWTCTTHNSDHNNAVYLLLTTETTSKRDTRKDFGFAIRPVCSE